MSTGRLIAVAVAALALLVGVGVVIVGPWRSPGDGLLPSFSTIGPPRIDVDTPRLRQAKARAGIADCVPGTGTNDLPAVTLPCFGGGPDVRLDRLAGPLIVNLWGSWCGPCQRELPYYQEASERLGDRVTVLGIDSLDPQTERAMDLLAATGVTYPQVADPLEKLRGARPRILFATFPVLVLVDADGTIAYANSIQIRSYDQLAGLVEQHLGVSA